MRQKTRTLFRIRACRGVVPAMLAASVFLLLACQPAMGSAVVAEISSAPHTEPTIRAAEYESLGIMYMNDANWTGLAMVTSEGLARYPDDPELHCLKGFLLRMTGHYAEAADNVSFAISRDPKPIRYANRGFAYLALGRDSDALADAETAISLDPSYPRAWAIKAQALIDEGDLSGAAEAIDEGINADSSDPLLWHLKGRILVALGNCTGARESFDRSLAIDPEYVPPWPEFGNASDDLAAVAAHCQAAGVTPEPTKSELSPVFILVVFAVGAALLALKR